MNLPARIAALATRFPGVLTAAAAVLTVLCVVLIAGKQRFDSEILNLLPSDAPSVRGLKLYNSEFTQARELAFLVRSPGDPATLEAFIAEFVPALLEEPWVARALDGPPTESPQALETLDDFAVPLLLNLPPEDFAAAMDLLEPEALAERIATLARRARGGSPAAAFELESDPSGLFSAALRPLFEKVVLDETFAVVSADGSAQALSVVTNQESLDAAASRELMGNVRAFVERSRDAFGPNAPEVLITGRAAYVAEISTSMQRDILLTSALSLAAICFLFYCAFGRWRPLAGVVAVLALSALAALAAGTLLFPELNLIAIAFCSILFGLGNDFSLLLYEEYLRQTRAGLTGPERISATIRNKAPGILCVAATTGAGFLGLLFSGSTGLAQLGALTALGITFCAAGMLSFFFVFLPARELPETRPLMRLVERGALFLADPPRWWTPSAAALLLVALAVALAPWRPLALDTRPSSLEPSDAPAAIALREIMRAFPETFEPVMLVVPAYCPAHARETALRLEQRLEELRERGLIAGYSGASPLLADSATQLANLRSVEPGFLERAGAAARDAAAAGGLTDAAIKPLLDALDNLRCAAERDRPPDWRASLPESSVWWFLIDRMLSPQSPGFLIFVRPMGDAPPSTDVLDELAGDGNVLVTGWSVMLESLAPWAAGELRSVGSVVGGVILLMLALIYRDWRRWSIHVAGMLFSFALIVAILKLADLRINLLNVLAFPLILGVGVDYGIHLLLAARRPGDPRQNLLAVTKPIFVAGLTTMAGFGALTLASNPSLRGLGLVCVTGIGSCLVVALGFILPACRNIYIENR